MVIDVFLTCVLVTLDDHQTDFMADFSFNDHETCLGLRIKIFAFSDYAAMWGL